MKKGKIFLEKYHAIKVLIKEKCQMDINITSFINEFKWFCKIYFSISFDH